MLQTFIATEFKTIYSILKKGSQHKIYEKLQRIQLFYVVLGIECPIYQSCIDAFSTNDKEVCEVAPLQ